MFDTPSRRTVLKASAAAIVGGATVTKLPSIAVRAAMSPGVARTVAIDPPAVNPSNSKVVDLTSAADPGSTGRGQVAYVTSSGTETTHYAFSLVNVRKRRLTVEDIETLSYDYYLADGSQNTVGDRPDMGPDEVWLIVQGPKTGGRTELFRTWNTSTSTGTWHTRNVDAELNGVSTSPWKKLSEPSKDFEEVGSNLIEAYGDARVHGVGFGRGDPVMGPSTLDIYYDALELNGETYSFPTKGK